MKKLKAIVCMIVIVLLLGGSIFSVIYFARDNEDKKIVVTTFPIYDICRELLDSDEEILLLQDTGSDMHSYQPTAKVISSISKADLFIFIGGESDEWVGDVIRSSDNVNLRRLSLMDSVEKLEESSDGIIESGHTHSHEHPEGHDHGVDCYDEHIWLSIRNMINMTRAIEEQLIDVFPHFEQMISDNAEDYVSRLEELDSQYTITCAGDKATIVMADRFPFLYLANDYNLSFLGAFTGCSSDAEASVSIISKLIEKVNEEELNNICVLENDRTAIAESVVSDSRCRSGVRILILNSVQSVGHSDLSTTSYISIMENNLKVLKVALNNENN